VRVPDETSDYGSPIAYAVLKAGTPVYTADREQIGTVDSVLAVPQEDVFDGIVIQTAQGPRFVDAPDVDRIFERGVLTTLTVEQATALPPHEQGPPVYGVDPSIGAGKSLGDRFRRLFGKARWQKR
jgi:hypothetical protein